eukprot:CAMPEP_0197025080 /NCGR_PEP_ID=MMETSP1384-20130603/5517_1 /TAXON_ID=29189 /ORGANISM="Ammonia sp." /LENGTH=299 /DNA_ID=CAMNT_0042453567 /DNA_START=1573 /DNA_END=2472 /DNA_ORIENTATION=-
MRRDARKKRKDRHNQQERFWREKKECKDLKKNPSDSIVAAPLNDNLFEWHFTIKGADKTEFEGGKYHGKFILPSDYPFKAPDIIMLTASGRFEIGKKICLNFTGYHHELWQPAWTIRTMLTALRAFMETPAKGIGAICVDKEQRKKYAKLSLRYKCPKCNVMMKDVQFPIVAKTETEKIATNTETDNGQNESDKAKVNEVEHENAGSNGDENETLNEEENQIPEIERRNDVDVQQEEQAEDDVNADNRSAETSVSSPPLQVHVSQSRKDKLLDSFTIVLVMVIVAILLKKFALRVLEQL